MLHTFGILLSLIRKTAAFDEEIQNLYEEMEQQIKKEKEEFLLKVSVCCYCWPEFCSYFQWFNTHSGCGIRAHKMCFTTEL